MTERPNKELALRYWSDDTLNAWWWVPDLRRWQCERNPDFDSTVVWQVGHEAPTEPPVKMCELAGVKFPMPMREAPEIGSPCWVANTVDPETPDCTTWDGGSIDRKHLAASMYQATSEGAIAQGRAMAAILKQAIEGAK